jgi:hypothetical protein
MWIEFLYSKRFRDDLGNIDGFHFLTDEPALAFQIVSAVNSRPGRTAQKHAAYLLECDGHYWIGVDGLVSDVLGDDSQHAYERPLGPGGVERKKRPIGFAHGYVAPGGTHIPDIGDLLREHREHLEEILRRANAGEYPVKLEPKQFASNRKKGTAWDKMATEFERGQRRNEGAAFTLDGQFLSAIPKSRLPSSTESQDIRERPAITQKKTLEPARIPRVGFLKRMINYLKAKLAGRGESPPQSSR